MRPVTVKRHLTEHSGGKPVGNFASASEIRKMIFENADFEKFFPVRADSDPKSRLLKMRLRIDYL